MYLAVAWRTYLWNRNCWLVYNFWDLAGFNRGSMQYLVLRHFFLFSLYCLSFYDLRLLITPSMWYLQTFLCYPLRSICVYFLIGFDIYIFILNVVITIRHFFHSWLNIGFVSRVTRRISIADLFFRPEDKRPNVCVAYLNGAVKLYVITSWL